MNAVADTDSDESYDDEAHGETDEISSKISDDFAFKLVNAVKSMNQGEISYYELVNSFSLADELKCLYLFLKALPYDPIIPVYPETPFFFSKGFLYLEPLIFLRNRLVILKTS